MALSFLSCVLFCVRVHAQGFPFSVPMPVYDPPPSIGMRYNYTCGTSSQTKQVNDLRRARSMELLNGNCMHDIGLMFLDCPAEKDPDLQSIWCGIQTAFCQEVVTAEETDNNLFRAWQMRNNLAPMPRMPPPAECASLTAPAFTMPSVPSSAPTGASPLRLYLCQKCQEDKQEACSNAALVTSASARAGLASLCARSCDSACVGVP